MSIRDWPTPERPRERLLAQGPEALSDAELLAVCIRSGTRDADALSLSRQLLSRFGGLRGLLDVDLKSLLAERGLGLSKASALKAAMELARRYFEAALKREGSIQSPRQAADYLRAHLSAQPRECFAVLFLDAQHRIIACETLFTGTLGSTEVHPREIVRRAVAHQAAAVILAHNHPSGVAEPSRADVQITQRVIKALHLIDLRVLDHFVIGEGEPVSMAERGLL